MDKKIKFTVTIPTDSINSLGDEGLTFVRGTWQAYYTLNGKRRRKSLSTTSKEEAIVARNWFYRILLILCKAPATYNRTGDEMIVEQKKYAVVVNDEVLYETNSKADARKFRNENVPSSKIPLTI